SVIVHLVLLDLAQGPKSGSQAVLASLLGLLAAPGMPLLSWIPLRDGLAASPGDTLLSPVPAAAGWTVGILMALACRAARHLIAGLQRSGLPPLSRRLAVGAAGVLLRAGLWLALSAGPVRGGGAVARGRGVLAACGGVYAVLGGGRA